MDRLGLFRVCGECDEPSGTFSICDYLGYNPGVDGHLFKSQAAAEEAMALLIKCVSGTPVIPGACGRVGPGRQWSVYPFKNVDEEVQYLEMNVKIIKVNFPTIRRQ